MNAARFLKLAEHLETGELGHERFYYGTYSRGPRNESGCGTIGCALGECPHIWPEAWYFSECNNIDENYGEFYPWLKDMNVLGDITKGAELFFEIDEAEFHALFLGGILRGAKGILQSMPLTATRYEVADRIRKFVQWKEEEA